MKVKGGNKKLIIVADDFGYHSEVDGGIKLAIVKGIVTSASVLVNGQDITTVSRFRQAYPNVDLGLHLNILNFRQNKLTANYVLDRFLEQYRLFERIFSVKPSNLSFHHGSEVRRKVVNPATRLQILVGIRILEEKTKTLFRTRLVDNVYTLALGSNEKRDRSMFFNILYQLKPGKSLIITHPGLIENTQGGNNFLSKYPLGARNSEQAILTSKEARAIVISEGITLTNFQSLAERKGVGHKYYAKE